MEVGDKLPLKAYVTKDGEKLDTPVRLFSRARKSLYIDSTMTATAYKPGIFDIIAIAPGAARKTFQFTVNFPPVTEISVKEIPERV